VDITRREALSDGLIIAGAAVKTAAGTPNRHRVLLGSNRGVFARFNAAMPAGILRACRVYYDTVNQFPTAWPNKLPGACLTLSLRPNPSDLLSGRLDTKLRAIIDSGPAHSQLTFWHENEPGNPLRYPRSVCNATTAVEMQKYGQHLCTGTQVRFGVIICAPAIQIESWIASKLDWYGIDQYLFNPKYVLNDRVDVKKLYRHLANQKSVFQHKSGLKNPQMVFPETNAIPAEHQMTWFTVMAEWAAANDCHRLETFWDGKQGLSGTWPPSRGVIDRLRYLSHVYR